MVTEYEYSYSWFSCLNTELEKIHQSVCIHGLGKIFYSLFHMEMYIIHFSIVFSDVRKGHEYSRLYE